MVLKNKKALITGGNGVIGKIIAEFFKREGCDVISASRSGDYSVDVSSHESVNDLMSLVEKKFGTLDILVNAAGVYGPIGPVEEVDTEAWRKSMDINLFGVFLASKAAIPLMKKQGGGKIINFVGGGEGAYPNFTSYVAAKGGVARFTETLAAELKNSRIDVNAIAPGAVNSKFLDDLLAAGPEKAGSETYERSLKQRESGGVSPNKAAALALFLASRASDGLSGKIISAVWDDYQNFPARLKEIMGSDVYTFRRVKDVKQ